jgi:hypothetical protein
MSDQKETDRDISSADQFPFAKSRRGADIPITGAENHFGLDPHDHQPKETAKSLPRLGDPSRNNLAVPIKGPPPLTADVEAELIVAAQSGNEAAKRRLLEHHEGWLRSAALKRWSIANSGRSNPDSQVEDFVSTALASFWASVLRWEPGHRLNTCYRAAITGALSDLARAWRNAPGLMMETEVARYISARPSLWDRDSVDFDAAVIELRKKFPKLSDAAVEFELNAATQVRYAKSYTEVGNVDDDGDHNADGEFKGAPAMVVGSVRGYEGAAISEWSRSQSLSSLHPCRLIDRPSDWVKPTPKAAGGSIFADRVLADCDRAARGLLRHLGRRAYAQRLVDKQRTDPKSKYFPTHEYCPPPATTSPAVNFRVLPSPDLSNKDFPDAQAIMLAA